MPLLPTVLLEHVRRQDTHHDWLIAPPGRGDADLWAGRVGPPTRAWAVAGSFLLTPLPPHRRRYLTYQGPISGGRGVVRRVDHGTVRPWLWTDSRLLLEVQFRHFAGLVEMIRLSPDRWRATVKTGSLSASRMS